ncbi:sugar phosphate isomerase/epimerase family protein [Pseudactinotalea sp.]|uniref:sugar phosphate isomerase/epimerase family protein n=1 Tax=Pseudactinotalea sp. TaxID=1926260 RepID=UPI003B3B3794
MSAQPIWSVFGKPWAGTAPGQLGGWLADRGFQGIEVPVRDGAFVTPERARAALPPYVAALQAHGVRVISVASDLDESVFAACAEAGVEVIRVMAPVRDHDYRGSVALIHRQLSEALPLCERHGVRIGVQPHHGAYVTSTLGVLQLIDDLPAEHVTIVWDAAHDALAGDDPVTTLELAWPRLEIVNLKNAHYRAVEGPEGTSWKPWFGTAHDGMADWGAALRHLAARGWRGPVCLSAQYSAAADSPERAAELVARDLRVARALWERPEATP